MECGMWSPLRAHQTLSQVPLESLRAEFLFCSPVRSVWQKPPVDPYLLNRLQLEICLSLVGWRGRELLPDGPYPAILGFSHLLALEHRLPLQNSQRFGWQSRSRPESRRPRLRSENRTQGYQTLRLGENALGSPDSLWQS